MEDTWRKMIWRVDALCIGKGRRRCSCEVGRTSEAVTQLPLIAWKKTRYGFCYVMLRSLDVCYLFLHNVIEMCESYEKAMCSPRVGVFVFLFLFCFELGIYNRVWQIFIFCLKQYKIWLYIFSDSQFLSKLDVTTQWLQDSDRYQTG